MNRQKANHILWYLFNAAFWTLMAGAVTFAIWLWAPVPSPVWKFYATVFISALVIALLVELFKEDEKEIPIS